MLTGHKDTDKIVLSKLDFLDLLRLKYSCKHFYNLVDDSLFKSFLFRDFPNCYPIGPYLENYIYEYKKQLKDRLKSAVNIRKIDLNTSFNGNRNFIYLKFLNIPLEGYIRRSSWKKLQKKLERNKDYRDSFDFYLKNERINREEFIIIDSTKYINFYFSSLEAHYVNLGYFKYEKTLIPFVDVKYEIEYMSSQFDKTFNYYLEIS